jgi:hypothetical protein
MIMLRFGSTPSQSRQKASHTVTIGSRPLRWDFVRFDVGYVVYKPKKIG